MHIQMYIPLFLYYQTDCFWCPNTRSIEKALDDLNSPNNNGSDLDELVSSCIGTFKNDVRYQNDVRFLKIWLLYVMNFIPALPLLVIKLEAFCCKFHN